MLSTPLLDDISIEQTSTPAAQFTLELDEGSMVVDRDQIRIGSSPVCEIHLLDGPLLHSVIRTDAGAVWIEVADEAAELNVNWRACRRMALRDGDVISVCGMDMTVRDVASYSAHTGAIELVENITQLTADEICDRILSEQASVDQFEAGRLQGMQKLMEAMKAVITAEPSTAAVLTNTPVVEFSDECQRLLDQIHEMSEMMNGRTRELDLCETELVAATELLEETQERVSRQIETLLDQIDEASVQSGLRASA
ncbi:MAG TPA: FHA domain-containing protein [Schlesneria sp.]|jgi:hypothetical protein